MKTNYNPQDSLQGRMFALKIGIVIALIMIICSSLQVSAQIIKTDKLTLVKQHNTIHVTHLYIVDGIKKKIEMIFYPKDQEFYYTVELIRYKAIDGAYKQIGSIISKDDQVVAHNNEEIRVIMKERTEDIEDQVCYRQLE